MTGKKKRGAIPIFYTNGELGGRCAIGNGAYATPISGQRYFANGKQTTHYGRVLLESEYGYRETINAVLKSADGFGESIEDAYEALYYWKRDKRKGSPYSAGSFCRNEFERLKAMGSIKNSVVATMNHILRPKFSGAWIESVVRGHVHRPVFHYDINSAYLYSASKGVPSRIYPYTGKNNPLGFVVVMDNIKAKKDLPNFFRKEHSVLVTSEEVDYYGITGNVLMGVQYYDLDVNLLEVLFSFAGNVPYYFFKRMTQAFWGMFASTSGIDVESMETGKERKMWNRRQNITWSSLIIRRVAMEVHKKWIAYDGISCFVDSVLCLKEVDPQFIGEDTGQWKIEGVYDKGIYIKSPGLWTPLPFQKESDIFKYSRFKKHSGYKRDDF